MLVPTEPKVAAETREKERREGNRKGAAGKGQKEEKERGESPESNKPAKIEVTLKLLHG